MTLLRLYLGTNALYSMVSKCQFTAEGLTDISPLHALDRYVTVVKHLIVEVCLRTNSLMGEMTVRLGLCLSDELLYLVQRAHQGVHDHGLVGVVGVLYSPLPVYDFVSFKEFVNLLVRNV